MITFIQEAWHTTLLLALALLRRILRRPGPQSLTSRMDETALQRAIRGFESCNLGYPDALMFLRLSRLG